MKGFSSIRAARFPEVERPITLFHEYLVATKKLLVTEPANSRIWVLSISTDSFGGVQEVVKGWTPDWHGVFTTI